MTQRRTPKQGIQPENGDQQAPTTIWGHSLAATAACIGTGAAIALVAIFG